jgi:hypothetical protein
VGVSMEFVIPISLTIAILRNVSADKGGVQNLLYLISSLMLGPFPIRYQIGHGIIETTSLFNSWLYMLVILVLSIEFLLRRKGASGIAFWACLLYVTLAVLAAVFSPLGFGAARRFLFSVTINYLVFLIAYLVASRNNFAHMFVPTLVTVFLCALLDGAYGISQFMFGSPQFELDAFSALGIEEYIVFADDFIKIVGLSGSAYGLFYSSIFFIIAPVLLFKLFQDNLRWLPVSVVIVSLGLLATLTERTGIVMLVIALFMVWIIGMSKARIPRMIFISILAAAIAVLIFPLLAIFLETSLDVGGLKFERLRELASPTEAVNIVWRIGKWEEGVSAIPGSLLLGDGYAGEFSYHMEYLNTLVTFGLFGFLSWSIYLVNIGKSLWKSIRESNPASVRYKLGISLFAFFIALLGSAIPNNPFSYTSGLILFVMAAPFCIPRRLNQSTGAAA